MKDQSEFDPRTQPIGDNAIMDTIQASSLAADVAGISLSGHLLQTVQRDSEFILHRARTDSGAATLLVLTPASEHPAPATLGKLAHAYSLRDELKSEWSVRPLSLTQHQGRTVLVLEDPGGEPLDRFLGAPMELRRFLRFAIGASISLGQCHGQGMIHKDIKPGNLLVNPETGRVWLMGFGIATHLPRERPAADPPQLIAGTLAYMAPEQTGWMNRSIDARSDLYALGITLYEMATGVRPFSVSEPLELVHCHIARRPLPPTERVPSLPSPISEILMNLLAKAAEDRYQTAAGVTADLRRCLAQWEADGRIEPFGLGTDDVPEFLRVPEKLYGRNRQVASLMDAFTRVVSSGTSEFVLVSGYSGIGKSSLVSELHKAIVPSGGLFASGKADQYKSDIPYTALGQALRSLVRNVLSKSEVEVGQWRSSLSEALRPNGQLMVDLVPELELITGKQPPLPELGAQESRNRFQLTFRSLIGVFAQPQHPLTLFLDDLQWLDTATLAMLVDLATHAEVRHLMLVGAYRDNEVHPLHPLVRVLDAIRTSGARVQEIVLAPLTLNDVGALVADALHQEREHASPLGRAVYEKTAGSPFFIIQFLTALVEEKLLSFNADSRSWRWDLVRIDAKGYTDNVVDLLVGKLIQLPQPTQKALKQLACLGNVAEIAVLSLIDEQTAETIEASLRDAEEAELIFRQEETYAFLHDRIQEAAYSLIPEDLRAAEHLRIGRILCSRLSRTEVEEQIFDIVNHFNRATGLLASEERERVAELNLIAGKRARGSAAYSPALNYFKVGAMLLPHDAWEHRYDLMFALEYHLAECEFLTGNLAAADDRLSNLLQRAGNLVDLAAITCLDASVQRTLYHSSRAVEHGLESLRHFGIIIPPNPTNDEVQEEHSRMWRQLGSRPIEALLDLPSASDRDWVAAMDILAALLPACTQTDYALFSLVSLRLVNLSLHHGNTDASCFGYVCLGFSLVAHFAEHEAAFRFGKLSVDLVERREAKQFKPRVELTFANTILPWSQHLRSARVFFQRNLDATLEVGDLTYAAVTRRCLITNLIAAGDPLAEVERQATNGLELARKVKFGLVVECIIAELCFVRMLQGLTPNFGFFNDPDFDEAEFEQRLESNETATAANCEYWIYKLRARLLAGDHESALGAATNVSRLIHAMPLPLDRADYHFYTALTHAAAYGSASIEERSAHQEILDGHQRQLDIWAQHCPENFESRAALVAAEIARIEGREFEAMRSYERAIQSARRNGFINLEALANELSGRFLLAQGLNTTAFAHLCNARACYASWGAEGKVRQLDGLYPDLTQGQPMPGPTSTITTPVEQLDLATVIKVSQAISGEIVLEKLINTLLRTAIEHAGAERGLLILPRDAELRIFAEANTGASSVRIELCDRLISASELPDSIVRYAARTQESVILEDAWTRGPFSSDEYIQRKRARSVLCLPLVKQGKLVAVLYLENNLAANVFTSKRIAVLNVLASEAAMSLENSRLYRKLEEREARIRRLVDANIVGVTIGNIDSPKIIEANDAFLDMLGYSREDLTSGRIEPAELTPVEWKAVTERSVAQIRAKGTCDVFEKEYIRKDGSRVPVLVAGAALGDTRSETVAFVLDLTERKLAEQERERLHQAQADLAHMNRVTTMGELTASLAHEIKQPIAATVVNADACLQFLQRENPDLEGACEAARGILASAMRAGNIIDRLQSLYKKSPPKREFVDLNEIVQEMVPLLRSEAHRYAVSIRTDLAARVPRLEADRVQLQQVLMNLMLNAIEAMKETGGVITIKSKVGEDGKLLISVSDSGVGLPDEKAAQIFDAFFTTKAQGSGMGLTISRSIIESHGGRLWATANDGRGATFHFTLPIADEEVKVSHPRHDSVPIRTSHDNEH